MCRFCFEMKTALDKLIDEAELEVAEMATVLDLTPVAVINKRAGRPRWNLNEAAKLCAVISARVGRRVSIEKAFEGSGIEPHLELSSTGRRR